MNVLVERYQRRKYVNQENAPMLYYIRQKSGNVRVMDIDTIATAIESKSALTAGDVKHTIEAFVEQLRASLTQGDKVKIDGLGTFHITLTSDGTELMKECTVRSTRSENNVDFVLGGKSDEDGGGNGGNGGNGGSGGNTPGGDDGDEAPDPTV